ncbi:DMT family transporter [Aliisedimentitalea scapharcae]|uniref:DMT family transporter n=1 Tax=Aliisedimentitalea scapharcae TaxID=1524259 RepID=A0ABZ2Y0U0_9RHOB
MRLTLLTTLTMIAFAANSVLNRLAVGPGYIDAESFALVRLAAGMLVLVGLALHQGVSLRQPVGRLMSGGVSLTVYMIGFSLAYKSLDAGLGALILFGVVQFTMVAWNTAMGAPLGRLQLGGGVLALAGLALVLWPQGAVSVSLSGVLFMVLAGLGWGAYSLVGRGAQSPLGATAGNFVLSFVLTLAVLSMVGWQGHMTPVGVGLAILSGAVTSGLGYALWYTVLPRLPGPLAATVQLSVPVLAIAAGALALGEHLDLRIILGSGIVIAGIATVLRGGISRKVG